MKIKKYVNAEEFVISNFEISHPFINAIDVPVVAVTLDLSTIIDAHDYHDFPQSETLYLDKKELSKLFKKLVNEMDSLSDTESK